MFFNNFSLLGKKYEETDHKPDKQYSILPTVIKLAGNLANKTVLDIGCGSGFFTFPLAKKGAGKVIGIDKSKEQIAKAMEKSSLNTEFQVGDIFRDTLPSSDVIVAPFVTNYSLTTEQLKLLFAQIYQSLKPNGHAVLVVDLPELNGPFSHKQRKQFGAVKWWSGNREQDSAMIQNRLYNNRGKLVCILWAYYYSPLTIQFELQNAGFHNIRWHKPEISEEGLRIYGEEFWKDYKDYPQLGYITVEK